MKRYRLGRMAATLIAIGSCAGVLTYVATMPRQAQTGAGTDTSPRSAQPAPGGRLTYGIESDPSGLDPTRNAFDASGFQLANALYDNLVAFDADGQTRPYLAEGFWANSTFTTWTVKLRPGVVFSNGDPLDAAALVDWIAALRKSFITGPSASQISAVEKLDQLTVQVHTARPWSSLPALLTGQGGYVVSPKQIADPEGQSHPIGTGPFVLARWDIDQQFHLVRNPRYWRPGLPYLDGIDFVVEPHATERVRRLRRGDLDVTALSASWELDELNRIVADGTGEHTLVERDQGGAEKNSVLFNTAVRPLNDVRIRRALAYATDLPAIAAANGWPMERLAEGPIDSSSPYFWPAPYPSHDPDRARTLVRDYLRDPATGYRSNEVTFTLLAPGTATRFAQQLADQWAKVGIAVKVSTPDIKQSVRLVAMGEFQASLFRGFSIVDPDSLWHFFASDTIGKLLSLNFARLSNPAIDEALFAGRATLDVETRRQAYARLQLALSSEVPYLWLDRSEWRIARGSWVHDARNVSLPDGRAAMPFLAGTHRLTETWFDR